MNKTIAALLCISLLLSLTGCPAPAKTGSVLLEIDLATLFATQEKVDVSITSVLVEVTREGHLPVQTSLAIANNTATGEVKNLAAGYWHIAVDVYSGSDLVFTGETDVNIIAGATVDVDLLFDPVVIPPTTGSVHITVGLNPLPGYKAMNQNIDKLMVSAESHRLYAYDSSTMLICVYDTANMNRIHEVSFDQAPLSLALNFAEDGIFLGYPSGQIYLLDFATETFTLVANALTQVNLMASMSDEYILVMGPGQSGNDFKTINVTTGQIVSSKNQSYSFPELLVNPLTHVVYGQRINVSPTDIHRIPVNIATGAIGTITDSRYHGDFSLGTPLRFVNTYSRICAASGNTFTSAELADTDLVYAGSMGLQYFDLASDDDKGYIYLVTRAPLTELVILNQSNYFVESTVDLLGTPTRVFSDDTGIIVITQEDARNYTRVFSKASLGL